jgi:DNA-binding transcriptional ArsR family regulator
MQEVLKALVEPRRRDILQLLGDGELAAGEIARRFSVSRPAISQHLQVLKAAGLVSERRAGTRHYYAAQPEALSELKIFLDQFWSDALDRLADAAEREQRRLDRGANAG